MHDRVRDLDHLGVRPILNRVGSIDGGQVSTECLGLSDRTIFEGDGCDERAGDSSDFHICRVVHTARCARASIGEGFEHRVTLGGDPLAQIHRANVDQLEVTWSYDTGPLEASLSQIQCNPIVVNGVLYATTARPLRGLAFNAHTRTSSQNAA